MRPKTSQKRKRIFTYGTVAVVTMIAFFIVLTVFLTNRIQNDSKSVAVEVRLAWLHNAQFAGMYLAKEAGLYSNQGLDVTLKPYEEGVNNMRELGAGDVEFAVVSAQEVIHAVEDGLPVKAVAAIYQTSPYAFASLKESGIVTPANFVGKQLGNEGGNQEAAATYEALLRVFNIPLEDVTFVNLNFDESNDLRLHRADTVDMYRTDQPYRFKLDGVDVNIIKPELYGLDIYGDVLVTSNRMIEEQPEVVQAFVDATLTGWERALNDPALGVATTMVYAEDYYKDAEYQTFILEESSVLIQPTKDFRIGSMKFSAWKAAYQAWRTTPDRFDATVFYTDRFVR